MKRHLPTIAITLVCSILSAIATAWVVSNHYQNVMMMFIGGRPADYLITAAKIREGKSDDLVKFLEYNAQVEFLQNIHANNRAWTFDYSHRILDAYTRKYNISLAEPLMSLDSPEKALSDDQFINLLSLSAPNEWPEWLLEFPKD